VEHSIHAVNRHSNRPVNRLLAALSQDVFERVRPDLDTIPTAAQQVFQHQGAPVEYVYFLNGGVGSIPTVLEDGTMVEAATVGDEGFIGIEAFFTTNAIASSETLMQVPDTDAERMAVGAFQREVARHGLFHDLIGQYAQLVTAQLMQSTACNATHNVEERCARWLLQTHDRMHGLDFHLSQEFLGVMLGVRRQSVGMVAATLQRAGLIRYTHGRVSVLDRSGLEAASCECFGVLHKRFAEFAERWPPDSDKSLPSAS
jgi:CRP-like cAMP-binding protein